MKTEQTSFANEDREMWFVKNNNTDAYSGLMVADTSAWNVNRLLFSAEQSDTKSHICQ